MNDDYNDILNSVFFLLALTVVCFTAFKIFDSITELKREELYISCDTTKGWSPPPIPKCDKELWDRIREGCSISEEDEQHD